MNYSSSVFKESAVYPGVRFEVRRMSLARRLELSREIRELSKRMEFADAGATLTDKVDASVLALEVDQLYLRWGLLSVHGLEIDGSTASPPMLIERGPEDLCKEIVEVVRAECGLTVEERKN